MPIIELIGGLAGCLLGAYLLSRPRQKPDTRLADAEAYIRDQHPLYRHYNIKAIQDTLRDKRAGRPNVYLTDEEVVTIVQKIRDEKGMGPIAYYNLSDWKEQERG